MRADSPMSSIDLASPDVLKKIDSLFACKVGIYINLPQLVVVGNQSSGKSSVLEGISKLPFPKDSGLCTQFATQIIFKRGKTAKTIVKIIPANDSNDAHKQSCNAWSATWDKEDPKSFLRILTEAKRVMGVRDDIQDKTHAPEKANTLFVPNVDERGKTFSEDTLKLECVGPNEGHFSIIDVPGIFKVATEGQTKKSDVELVERIVKSYVSNPRSIILAVVPANVDLATEEILNIAEKHDPEGARTVGVLTKPDLIDPGAEAGVIDVLQGKAHKLTRGWHIVRNLGQKESKLCADRDKLEQQFFDTQDPENPWSKVNARFKGIASLRTRLMGLMQEHTKKEFPSVKADLEDLLRSSRAELEELGPTRDSVSDQQQYLITVATKFQDLVGKAIHRQYASTDFFRDTSMRLVTNVANRGDLFAKVMTDFGHTYEFDTIPGEHEDDSSDEEDESEPQTIHTRVTADLRDLRNVLSPNSRIKAPIKDDIMAWLEELYASNRGLETMSGADLKTTLTAQSEKWNRICQGYISDVIVMVHTFLHKLLHHVCLDEHVRTSVYGLIELQVMEGYRKAVESVQSHVLIEQHKSPATQNEGFNQTMQKNRASRFVNHIEGHGFIPTGMGTKRKAIWIDDIQRTMKKMTNRQWNVQQTHDELKAYYNVASKRLVDVVINTCMESNLLSVGNGPLNILSSQWVSNLALEKLGQIAGEDVDTKIKRHELTERIADLEKGKQILMGA